MIACCLIACLEFGALHGQQSAVNFHKLGITDGLHDGTVRCIGQDRYGYIWIGTVGALNRYDGKNVVHYTRIPGDSTSPYGSQPRCILSDKAGRLWIGFETGLMEYDLDKGIFKKVPTIKDQFVGNLFSLNDSILYVASRRGLIRYNTRTGDTLYFARSSQPRHTALYQNAVYDIALRNGTLYLATGRGLVLMDLATQNARLVPIAPLGEKMIHTLALDAKGNTWLGTYQDVKLMKLDSSLQKLEIYDRFLTSEFNTQPLNVMEVLVDSKDRTWVVTAIDGLMQYVPQTNSFIKHLHNRDLPSSPSGNNYRSMFQDDSDIIWLGTDFAGINFFEPDKFLFKTIHPFPDRLDERARGVARAITEDKQGNLWMGNHDGVTRYDPVAKTYTIWRNESGKKPALYNNVVRSIHCDDENNIWIGTATGVNRYNARTRQMEFIPEKDLPLSFYNSITQDREGNIWFCGNLQAGLNWYSTRDKQYHSIFEDPLLKPYAGVTATSYVMQDSKGRLWISYARLGVLMVDRQKGKVTQYLASDTPGKSIIGNQVVDIKEDKTGVVWITSFNGISGIDVEKNTFLSFDNKNGLPGNWCTSLGVDDQNRLWVGVNGGLTMISADRKRLTRFSLADGLPSIGFPEHAGVVARNGDILFATFNGYIRFSPASFHESRQTPRFFVSSYSIAEKPFQLPTTSSEGKLAFKADQNSFSFNLVALNYINPHENWFAYKLQGFDQNWHYTQDPHAVYTNVPGGNYTFLYKAAVGNTGWQEIQAKQLAIALDTFFYKTAWFWWLVGLAIALGLYAFYRYRTGQERQLYLLRGQAQVLEKEKAKVMYESLKQQLNPHFLFNSLTSLSGLIETDQHMAGEFLEQMSDIYRYILKNGDSESVPLKDEINFVKLYITLQQTRFRRGLEVNIDVPEEYLHYKIAPVTLQNLIENAIKHNIIDAQSPLVINIFVEDDYLVVENNLQRKSNVETSNKKGLDQFVNLYRYLSEKPVLISETEDFFFVRIPLI